MINTLLWVLLPLFLGFSLYTKNRHIIRLVDQGLNILIYLILFIMGISLAEIPDLASELAGVLYRTMIFIVTILGANLIAFMLIDRALPFQNKSNQHSESKWGLLLNTGKLFISILLGIVVGYLMGELKMPDITGQLALTLLLFLIGIQLRANGIHLREVLLNRYGLILTFAAILSALLGGVIASLFIEEISITQGLAISSGFGWYSLSFIIISDAYDPLIGSIALINDLFREFFAFAMIPILMRRYPLSAVGVGGATSLDFTLPLLQKTGGIKIVPVAISFGFLINLITPLFLVFFSNLPI